MRPGHRGRAAAVTARARQRVSAVPAGGSARSGRRRGPADRRAPRTGSPGRRPASAGGRPRYVRDSVTESLAELGYAVDEGFQTAVVKDGILQVSRSEWDAHGVRMVLDEENQELRAAVVRTQDDTGWDAARVDAERETQWCAIQEKLKFMLAARNVTYEVRSLTKPGSRRVPVVRATPPVPVRLRPAGWARRDHPADAQPRALSGHHPRPGRTSWIWVQGCTIGCRGCASQDTWPTDPVSWSTWGNWSAGSPRCPTCKDSR